MTISTSHSGPQQGQDQRRAMSSRPTAGLPASSAARAPATAPNFPKILANYVDGVLSGQILACKWVRLACQRHADDLEKARTDPDYAYYFDDEKVKSVCRFGSMMRHVKGKWAGERIKLESWQVFILGCIFGWQRKKDNTRRFREAFIVISRKNGKSLIACIVGLYMLVGDGEKGSEVYSGATTLDQALEVFRPAFLMVERDETFRRHFGLELGGTTKNPRTIYRLSDSSRFEPVIGKPGDGASPSCGIVDEYHEHKSPDLFDTLLTGMGARSQPLLFTITTAGVDTSVPCFDKQREAERVLDGVIEQDDLFAAVYTIDADDDWTDFSCWEKANPNLGVSIYEDFLRARHKEAMSNPARKPIILTKHLDQWQNAGQAWMDMLKWGACADEALNLSDFYGQECWIGLDLANKIDIAALRVVFRSGDGYAGFGFYFLPHDRIYAAENTHYQQWLEQGWIIETPGATTDFSAIKEKIQDICSEFNVKELAYDPKEASYFIMDLQEQEWAGFECIEIVQSPANISEPTKSFEALIYAGNYRHNGDPVMTWMMSNCVLKQARSGGPIKVYFLTKERNTAKIDGPVAEIMALSRALLHQPDSFVGYEEWD